MNWLLIAVRELRVASRKSSTFWVRLAAALTAAIIGSGCFLVSTLQQTRLSQIGIMLFGVLSWVCAAAALSAGLFFTSDCLSQEKREGTLGLLFVTHLRGYDVVLGKLLATSLRAFYALLALLPILAITELMGGITGAQYWKTALALVNALFVSLAVGMFVSAISRDAQKALAATLLLLLALAVGGLAADAIIAGLKKRAFSPAWSLSSPGYVLAAASAWGRSSFWPGLLATHLLGWVGFVLACLLVPRTWQERKRTNLSNEGWRFAWKYGGARQRLRLRETLLERRPIAWLASRECWQSRALWGVAILLVVGFFVVLTQHVPQEVWFIWNYIGGLFTLVIYVWAASQACRLLVEARQSGFLELLVVTPLGVRQIIGGQWRALWRSFGIPLLMLISLHVVGATLSQLSFQRIIGQATAASTAATATNQAGVLTNQSGVVVLTNQVGSSSMTYTVSVSPWSAGSRAPGRPTFAELATAAGAALAAGLSTAANLLALGWFGMWMGMTSKSANLATLKTLLFVQIIPWFVIFFGAALVVPMMMAAFAFRGATPQSSVWLSWWPFLNAALAAILAIVKDVGFILWSRNRLFLRFREQAARTLGVVPFAPPAPVVACRRPPSLVAK